VRTAKAVLKSGAIGYSGSAIALSTEGLEREFGGLRSVVGLGFCLKPMNPPCPSGRANHDCAFLENLRESETRDVPAACRACAIREIGTLTLKTGSAFYIMTSARDILLDLFVPAIDERQIRSGLFLLCRYSLRPFAIGLLASGIRGWLFTFDTGDCRDYRTWLQADIGIKKEQTGMAEANRKSLRKRLMDAANEALPALHFVKHGNVMYPQ